MSTSLARSVAAPFILIGLVSSVSTLTVACGSEPVPEPTAPLPERADVEPEPESTPAPPPAAPAPAPNCNGAMAVYDPMPAMTNLLFLVDRSGSMRIKLPNGKTRFTATREALGSLLDKSANGRRRASAIAFPQGDTPLTCCSVTTNAVSCNCATYPSPEKRCATASYAPAMPKLLDATTIADLKSQVAAFDDGFYWGTPLAPALAAGVATQKAATDDGVKAVVLLTDGEPTSCESATDPNANDIQRVIDAAKAGISAEGPQVRTFVIGIMDGGSATRASLLSKVASAGLTARTANCVATDSCFYPVDVGAFEATLGSALDRIAKEATGCTFDLPAGTTSATPNMTVTLNRTGGPQALLRDETHKQGFDFVAGQNQIQLYGEACRVLKDETTSKLQITAPCVQ